METVLQISWESILADLPIFAVLSLWNLFVILVFSKKVYYSSLKKGWSV
mgnify:FL=1